jgi:uncharacterized protein (DUF2062 family)
MAGRLSRWRDKTRALWARAKNERATPREIGFAVAIGAFVGCSPALGFHTWLSLGAATLFKLNRLYAFLGSRLTNSFFLPFVIIAEIEVSHVLRTGQTLPIERERAVAEAHLLLLDWCLGSIPVGLGLALVAGFTAYGISTWRAKRRAAKGPVDQADA